LTTLFSAKPTTTASPTSDCSSHKNLLFFKSGRHSASRELCVSLLGWRLVHGLA
jgi:hypothetical protein